MSDERITSLPVLSDLDGSEWLVVDDGSTTQRLSSGDLRKSLPIPMRPHAAGPAQGSPTFDMYQHPSGSVARSRQSVVLLADGTHEGVLFDTYIPPEITSNWKLRVYWVYSGTSTGDVHVRAFTTDPTAQTDGTAFSDETTLEVLNQTRTDPGEDVLQIVEGAAQSVNGWRNINVASWDGTLSAGESIHVLHVELVAA